MAEGATAPATGAVPARAGAGGVAEGGGPRMPHVGALDGLRGLAVAAVVAFHAGWLTGGWLGVDLFFVLSGYLITSLLLVEHRGSDRVDLVAFWGRRARRILPALLLVLLAVTLYAAVAMSESDQAATRDDTVAAALFVANWHDVATASSYFDQTGSPAPLAHLWSLSVEEQLYLVWPVVVAVVLARRRGRGRASAVARAAGALAAASAAVALGAFVWGASPDRIYLGTDTRAVALLLGAAVAGLRRRPGGIHDELAGRLDAFACVAGVVLLALWWRLDGADPATYRGGLLLASGLGAVVVAAAADRRSRLLAGVLGLAPLRALGRISFGVYLWHLPVFVALTPARVGVDGLALDAVRIVVALALAAASWALVEQPIRRRRPAGWWEGRRGGALAVGATALVVAVAVASAWGATGLERRGLADGVAASSGAPAGAPKVVVAGDSVAASIARPAIDDPEGFGVDVVRTTVNGCQAVWDGEHRARGIEGEVTTPGACPPGLASLVAEEAPAVVLVSYGGWTDAELEVDGTWRRACDPAYDALLRARLDQVLGDAASSGAVVVAVTAARSTNDFRPAGSDERTACANEVLGAAAGAAGVPVVDLDAWLCPGGECRRRIDGLPVRSDGVHLQGPGGAGVARWVLTEALGAVGLAPVGSSTSTTTPTAGAAAVADACRAYGSLVAVTDGLRTDGLDGPQVRAGLDEAFGLLTPELLAALQPDGRVALEGVVDPALQAELRGLLDRAVAGEVVDPATDLPPGSTERLDRAFAWFRTSC